MATELVRRLIEANENSQQAVMGSDIFYRAAERIDFLEKRHEELMDEIRRLRSLEDSYDTETEVLSELLLGLNKLCGT
jgi:hypothetical protein